MKKAKPIVGYSICIDEGHTEEGVCETLLVETYRANGMLEFVNFIQSYKTPNGALRALRRRG